MTSSPLFSAVSVWAMRGEAPIEPLYVWLSPPPGELVPVLLGLPWALPGLDKNCCLTGVLVLLLILRVDLLTL